MSRYRTKLSSNFFKTFVLENSQIMEKEAVIDERESSPPTPSHSVPQDDGDEIIPRIKIRTIILIIVSP
jgi:hypothetical protein